VANNPRTISRLAFPLRTRQFTPQLLVKFALQRYAIPVGKEGLVRELPRSDSPIIIVKYHHDGVCNSGRSKFRYILKCPMVTPTHSCRSSWMTVPIA
jgi:hypothetical protein